MLLREVKLALLLETRACVALAQGLEGRPMLGELLLLGRRRPGAGARRLLRVLHRLGPPPRAGLSSSTGTPGRHRPRIHPSRPRRSSVICTCKDILPTNDSVVCLLSGVTLRNHMFAEDEFVDTVALSGPVNKFDDDIKMRSATSPSAWCICADGTSS